MNKETRTYRLYSKNLNDNKFNHLKNYAENILIYKNRVSTEISSEILKYSDMSKFDIVKLFGNSKSPLEIPEGIRGNDLQKAVADVIFSFENKNRTVKEKMQFKVQKSIKISKYKRKTKNNVPGDIKEYKVIKKSTKFTKTMTFLAKSGYTDIIENLKNISEFKNKNIELFFKDVIYFLEKFGEDRLLRLALQKRKRIIEKFNYPIVFKELSFRTASQSNEGFLRNHKGYTNAVIILPKVNGRYIVIPTNFSLDYHGHLNSFKSKEFTVKIEKDRVSVFTTKETEVKKPVINKKKIMGVDTNLKHNLFSTSINETIDYDRKMFNGYVKFLKKIDKKENLSKGEEKQKNLWMVRIENMLKQKCSELIDLAIKNNKDHIVLEDLELFAKSFVRSLDLEGFKYSRLVRMLKLSGLIKYIKSIAIKKGIQITIINPHYTSQMCNCCGHISWENRITQEVFKCVLCGDSRNADLNSSFNIALIGINETQEVLENSMLKEDSSSWFVPKFSNKEIIRTRLEDIITQDAFQQNRKILLDFIYS